MDLLSGDIELRSKRELIEKFIKENLPQIDDDDSIVEEFEKYWQDERICPGLCERFCCLK